MTTTAMVLGAGTSIGRHLVERLSQIRVRVCHAPRHADAETLTEHLRNVDVLFHLSSPASAPAGELGETRYENHVLLECAYRAEVRCIVHSTPSAAAGFSERADLVRDEAAPARRKLSPSEHALWAAEEESLEFSEWTEMPVIAVRTAMTIGPADDASSWANYPIRTALQGRLAESIAGGFTVAHPQDLADGHILAWRRGRPGSRYLLGGQRVEIPAYVELVSEVCASLGLLPTKSRSSWWPRLSFAGSTPLGRAPQQWRDLSYQYAWFTCEKAIRELGYYDRPVEESLRLALEEANQRLSIRAA